MRTVWYITAGLVLVTMIVFGLRELRTKKISVTEARQADSNLGTASRTPEELVAIMRAQLTKDAQVRRKPTQATVAAVATLVEQGRLDSAEGYYALALRSHAQGKLEASEQALRKAIALKPDWNWPHNVLGIVLYETGRKTEAETSFHKAMDLDPKWSRPHNDLAILYRKEGKLEDAEREARTALSLDPESLATQNNYGNLLVARRRYAEAEAAYRKALELDPGHPAPYFNLACLSSIRKQKTEALEYLRKAIELDDAFRLEALEDKDLEALRADAEFRKLVQTQ
ncbi:MAG: tetratricopeptide repeat protein [Candidatus Hydrogenedentes bacterium]|nr:tetratricopeptide repeat protein [Candidatus Hydrogenedentota bacterium]